MDATPQQLATRRRELAMDYNKHMKRLGELKQKKALEIISLRCREDVTSDKQAERLWDATDDGQEEIKLTYLSKGLLELMRAVKSEIDIMQAESFNQY